MFKHKYKLYHHFLLLLSVLVLSGFSSPQLKNLEMLVVQENFEQAKIEANQLLETQRDERLIQQVEYFSALIDLRMGKYAEAQAGFRKLTKSSNDVVLADKASLGLIDAYYLSHDYEMALMIAEQFLRKRSKTDFQSLLLFKLARINLKLAKWVEARDYLRRIIRQHPRSMEVSLAKQFLEEKQFFAVQVGAFLDRQKAQMQVEELKRKGQYAYIVETTDGQNRKFYRVRVGQHAYLNEAEELKTKLAQQGYPSARVYP